MPRKLFLTTRQKTKIRNAVANNMQTDIKLSEAQLPKLIQSGGFLGALLGKLAGPLMKVDVSFTIKKKRVKGAVRAGKGITLVISNKDMDDTIRII